MSASTRALAVVLALVAGAYAVALPGPYQFDDYATIAVDPGAASLAAWWSDVTLHVRPLTKASFAVTAALGAALGNLPLGHRIGNLLIHLATVAMFAVLAKQVVGDTREGRIAALAAAAIFGLHPFATEAVTYLSGRSVALGTLLALCSLVAWNRGAEDRSTAWRAVSVASFAAAVLARETVAASVPVLIVMLELRRGTRAALVASLPFAGIVLLAAAWMHFNARYDDLVFMSRWIAATRPHDASLLTALAYFASSFLLLRHPNIDPAIDAGAWGMGTRVAGTLLVVAICAWAWRARERRPHWLFGLAWSFAWLAPIYALPIRHDAIAERHLYPALWGLALPIAVEAAPWLARGTRAAWAARGSFAFVLAGLFAFTLMRNLDYTSEIALWQAAVRGAPDNVRALHNLGFAYMDAARWDDSVAVLSHAAELAPYDPEVRWKLRAARAHDLAVLRQPAFIESR